MKNSMTNSRQSFALIGCGNHSQENIIPALAQLEHVQCIWVADPNVSSAAIAARRLGTTKAGVNWLDFAKSKLPDAFLVVGPPQLHEQVIDFAIDHSKPIFVEKPPARDARYFSKLSNAAAEKNLVTMVGHNLRHANVSEEFNRIVNDREFGTPVAIEMRYFASKPRGDRWDLGDPVQSFLLSHVNHAVDFMIYHMGSISRVSSALVESGTDSVSLSAQFRFENGAIGNLFATSAAPHFDIRTTVVSDKHLIAEMIGLNELKLFGVKGDGKRWGRNWTERTLNTGYESAGYLTELRAFFSAVSTGDRQSCRPSFEDEMLVYSAMAEIKQKLVKERLRSTKGSKPFAKIVDAA